MKVWYIDWHTESGDRGQIGAWEQQPSSETISTLMFKLYPDEYCEEDSDCEHRTIYWEVKAFNLTEQIEQ